MTIMNKMASVEDLWEPIHSLHEHGRHVLTSVEMTVTNLCNMRCEHCAVGNALTETEGERIPLEQMIARLDEVEHLQTISITGGEPSFRKDTMQNTIVPLLEYAKNRGLQTQINTNLTLDYERYEWIAELVDVMHISFNYTNEQDYHQIGFARSRNNVTLATAEKLYRRMIDNARKLSARGVFVSAESMINMRTHHQLADIHRLVAEMGCRRHEIHPMYPIDFAADLSVLSLDEIRDAIKRLLAQRDPDVWILFGTLPFFRCSSDERDHELLRQLEEADNVTVRNDPDGRNRLNVDMFTGKVYVTDFSEVSALGDIKQDSLDDVFARWQRHPVFRQVNCHCPAVSCCGPNWLVKETYYRDVDFHKRKAII